MKKRRPVRTRGFLYWGIACLLIAVLGLVPGYFMPIIRGTYKDLTPLMPLHTLSVTIWMLLVVTQPALVVSDNVRQHKRNGVVGAVVAFAVVVTGLVVQLEVMAYYAALGDVGNAVLTPFFRFVTLLVFAFAVWAALIYRHHSDWHKRLVLLGTFAILEAPLGRLAGHLPGAGDDSGLLAAVGHTLLMAAFVIWDRLANGRFHPASLWGSVTIVLINFATAPLAYSQWWEDDAAALAKAVA